MEYANYSSILTATILGPSLYLKEPILKTWSDNVKARENVDESYKELKGDWYDDKLSVDEINALTGTYHMSNGKTYDHLPI